MTAYLILVTDNIVYMPRSEGQLDKILDEFGDFFSHKVKKVIELQFLNYRILLSEYGTSINQTNHILQSVLDEYFDKGEIKSSPFPLDSKFDYVVYSILPMMEEELIQTEKKDEGKYNHWIGTF